MPASGGGLGRGIKNTAGAVGQNQKCSEPGASFKI